MSTSHCLRSRNMQPYKNAISMAVCFMIKQFVTILSFPIFPWCSSVITNSLKPFFRSQGLHWDIKTLLWHIYNRHGTFLNLMEITYLYWYLTQYPRPQSVSGRIAASRAALVPFWLSRTTYIKDINFRGYIISRNFIFAVFQRIRKIQEIPQNSKKLSGTQNLRKVILEKSKNQPSPKIKSRKFF